MLLLSNSLLINLLPLVENLFALGQKPFRHGSKTFSPLVKSLFDTGQKPFRLRAKSKGVVVMLLIPVYLLIN